MGDLGAYNEVIKRKNIKFYIFGISFAAAGIAIINSEKNNSIFLIVSRAV